MITIEVKNKENYINFVKIKGHAGYAEEGFDIICASVSSIAITTVNAIVRINEKAIVYSEDDGLLEIGILEYNETINILMENMKSMFEELEKQYEEYIKIR